MPLHSLPHTVRLCFLGAAPGGEGLEGGFAGAALLLLLLLLLASAAISSVIGLGPHSSSFHAPLQKSLPCGPHVPAALAPGRLELS